MNLVYAFLAFLLAIMLILAGISRIGVWLIERRNPPAGTFADVDEVRIHHVYVPGPRGADRAFRGRAVISRTLSR